ncbi:hypothetical protein F5J12DRAFT_787235 [Pisolithus orientalis]|uniref:uncharacterized protein n=1 Tax=Pisolithus orientalis TaxID=936130 RepID=UPI00222547DA|nr:uncharacterized protein F5J12DRAFT_787235 [Pisolithus orientalis]KAI5986434.1 hypothetical protein F5J12DRAFT_787235 [Pisolithus orientalis]
MTESALVTVTCHPEFYFENGMFIFQVKNTLYKLNHNILVNEPKLFTDVFSLGQYAPDSQEGKVDGQLIILSGKNLTVQTFDLFIKFKFMCPCPSTKYSLDDLENLLEFVCHFQCSACMLSFITSCVIERAYFFHPSELIYLSIEYKIQAIFKRGFTRLCKVSLTKIKKSHCVQMGMDTYVAYVYVRSHLDEYICTVAAEFPPIVHSSSCQDHKGCAKDWAAVWWNGMGQLLLDGRNPQHLDKAVNHFKGLQFGQCFETLFQISAIFKTEGAAK